MSIVNDSHHQNQLLRVRLSKCRLEDVMENRNPSQKHSWQAQQPLNTDMHRHANDMHRHAQTRDFKNETTCTDTRNNLFFRVIGHSRRFAWSWGRRRSHQTWVVRSMSQHVKQVKNSVPQNMTNKTSITTVHMQTWSMTTCTYTHAFSRQQVCFPVRVHLLLWDKGSTPWRSRPLGAKDDVRLFDFVIPKDDVRDFAIPKDDVVRHRHSKIPGHPRRRLSILHFHLDTWSKSNLPMLAHLRWLTEAAPDHLLTTAKASASSDRSPPSPTNASTAGPLHSCAKPSPELQHQTKIHKLHKPTDIKHKIHKSTKQNPQNNPQ